MRGSVLFTCLGINLVAQISDQTINNCRGQRGVGGCGSKGQRDGGEVEIKARQTVGIKTNRTKKPDKRNRATTAGG